MIRIIEIIHYFCPTKRGVAQLASALAWGARGRMFESFRPDFKKADKQQEKGENKNFLPFLFAHFGASYGLAEEKYAKI